MSTMSRQGRLPRRRRSRPTTIPSFERTRRVWQYLSERQAQDSVPPSQREIEKATGLKAHSHVVEALRALDGAGYVEVVVGERRAYRVLIPLRASPHLAKSQGPVDLAAPNTTPCPDCGMVHYPRQPVTCPFPFLKKGSPERVVGPG